MYPTCKWRPGHQNNENEAVCVSFEFVMPRVWILKY